MLKKDKEKNGSAGDIGIRFVNYPCTSDEIFLLN